MISSSGGSGVDPGYEDQLQEEYEMHVMAGGDPEDKDWFNHPAWAGPARGGSVVWVVVGLVLLLVGIL